MSVIAAALRELIEAGVTGDALVTAITNIENATLPKRSAGAARQARYRERHSNVTSVTSDEPHIDRISESKKNKKVSIAIPPDCVTSDADRDYARSKGWSEARIDSEFERFKNNAIAKNQKYADWHRAWCNWVTSPYQQNGGVNGSARKQTLVELSEQLADEAREIERRAGIGREDDAFGSG